MRRPTATAILGWTARIFGKDAATRVFEPLLADYEHELALASTRWRRRLVTVRWSVALAKTLSWTSWHQGSPSWRATWAMCFFTLAGTVALIAPFSRMAFSQEISWPVVAYLAPQALGLALPFSVLPVALILGAAATSSSTDRLRRRLGVLVAGVACVTAINLAVIVPEANQAFRATVVAATGRAPRVLGRGARELGIVDLWRARGVEPAAARRELRNKTAIALTWPWALATLGWRLGRHRQSASAAALLFWWLAAAAIAAVSEPARHTPYLRGSPYLAVTAAWCVAAWAARPRRHAHPAGAVR